MTIERTAIVGKGALGLLYADLIARNLDPDAVEFVMDEARAARHAGETVTVNGEARAFRTVTPAQALPADLVIFAVKSPALEDAIELAAPLVGPETLLVSVLNGVTSEERIAARFGWERIVPCVAQGMDAMRFGADVRYTQTGALHIGRFEQTPEGPFEAVRAFFERAGIPCVVEQDIRHRMWAKFMANVGLNQTCAVYGVTYSQVLAGGEEWRTYIAAMREVIAVARAEGVALEEADLTQMVEIVRTLNPNGTPSMGQDRINRNPSEVDEFSGVIMRLAARHRIHVPANEYLNARMKEIEASYVR